MRLTLRIAIAAATALLLAACSSTSGGRDPGPVATTGPTITATTRATTTTTAGPATTASTLGPAGIVDAFISNFTDPTFQAGAELAVWIDVDGTEFPGAGRVRISGVAFHGVTDLGPLGRIEKISVVGVEFERAGDGPWILESGAAGAFEPDRGSGGPDLELVAWLRTLGSLEHAGSETENGVTVHHLVPADQEIDPASFGFSPEDDVVVGADFWARDDGSPHRMLVSIVDVTDLHRPVRMTMELSFDDVGAGEPIVAPTDYLVRRPSDDLGYSIAVPESWDRVEERSGDLTFDLFLGLDAQELHVYPAALSEPGEVPLNVVLSEYRSSLDGAATRVIDARETTVGTYPGRMLRYEETIDGFDWQVFYVVSQQAADRFYEFLFWDLPGDLDGSTAFIEGLLGTFEPAGG